ncbi:MULTISPECIES: hypothetical protein [unclassified Bradyrhizobium]|uniref:hypothetical protein n=1 Tax=unclassified Bradyrhizobium TaxID=2631580 RepID=UPI00339A03BC
MRSLISVLRAGLLVAVVAGPASATPNCLRDNKPYKLAGDRIEWAMKIAPGADCIQGLRWSTMQIYHVEVAEEPKSGELVLVGPGFRYHAKPDFAGTDKFSLVVVGKNRHDEGKSTVEITVSRPSSAIVVSAAADSQ